MFSSQRDMYVCHRLVALSCDNDAPRAVRDAAERTLDAAFHSLLRPWWRLPAGPGGDDGDTDETAMVFDGVRCAESIQITAHGNVARQITDKVWGTVLAAKGFAPQTGVHTWTVNLRRCTRGYVFLGVATREASTSNYIGGDNHGWGMIGTKALWHGHQKVRAGYGQTVTTGMTILVTLDTNRGTLSFGLQGGGGGDWGVAFQNVQARDDLYPAVALYQKDDEARIAAVKPRVEVSSDGDGERMAAERLQWEAGRAPVPFLAVGATSACMRRVAEALSRVAVGDFGALSELLLSHGVRGTLASAISTLLSWADSHYAASASMELLDAASALTRACAAVRLWQYDGDDLCSVPEVADVSGLWVFNKRGDAKDSAVVTSFMRLQSRAGAAVTGVGGSRAEMATEERSAVEDTLAWRKSLQVGSAVDAMDRDGVWYKATVEHVREGALEVHFDGWARAFNEQFAPDSAKLAPISTHAVAAPLRISGHSAGFQLELDESTCGVAEGVTRLSGLLSADCSSFSGKWSDSATGKSGTIEASLQEATRAPGQERAACQLAAQRLHTLCASLAAKVSAVTLGGRIDDGVDDAVEFVANGVAMRDARPSAPAAADTAAEPAYAALLSQYSKELAGTDPFEDASLESIRRAWSSELAECFDVADDAAGESNLFTSSVVVQGGGGVLAGGDEEAAAAPGAPSGEVADKGHAVLATAELWAASPLFCGGLRDCVLHPCVAGVLGHVLVGRELAVDGLVLAHAAVVVDDNSPSSKQFFADFLSGPGNPSGDLDDVAALVVDRSLIVRRGTVAFQVWHALCCCVLCVCVFMFAPYLILAVAESAQADRVCDRVPLWRVEAPR